MITTPCQEKVTEGDKKHCSLCYQRWASVRIEELELELARDTAADERDRRFTEETLAVNSSLKELTTVLLEETKKQKLELEAAHKLAEWHRQLIADYERKKSEAL